MKVLARGSIATPGPATLRHGGNTPVEVQIRVILIDAARAPIRWVNNWSRR